MQGCFSLMLGFANKLQLDFDAALVRGADISWISVNNSKPDRNDKSCLLIHSTNKWADAHIDDDRTEVLNYLRQETSEIIGHDLSIAEHQAVHGWRYANIQTQQNDITHFFDQDNNIGVCGDWFIKGRVEAAFTSAHDLANHYLQNI